MRSGRTKVLGYPRARSDQRRRPPAVDIPIRLPPALSRDEQLVVLLIILILVAILVPVVRTVRENAEEAAAAAAARPTPTLVYPPTVEE